MLHDAHFAIKREVLTFAAVSSNGGYAQIAVFAKLIQSPKSSRSAQPMLTAAPSPKIPNATLCTNGSYDGRLTSRLAFCEIANQIDVLIQPTCVKRRVTYEFAEIRCSNCQLYQLFNRNIGGDLTAVYCG
jgi:hypothetical protein